MNATLLDHHNNSTLQLCNQEKLPRTLLPCKQFQSLLPTVLSNRSLFFKPIYLHHKLLPNLILWQKPPDGLRDCYELGNIIMSFLFHDLPSGFISQDPKCSAGQSLLTVLLISRATCLLFHGNWFYCHTPQS